MGVGEGEALREAARAAGHALRSPWRDQTPPGPNLADAPHVIRFKTPTEGETVIDDVVRGHVRFPNKDIEDFVLLRTDGTTVYNLAVTVDDHDMGVTHVIRGEEHLSNAGRQTLLYQALGWPLPRFAHLPLILGADGAKLSKRHGAQSVGDFRAMGYLPEAMRNYLAKLGWGHGDDELFSDEQAIAWFDIADVVKAGAKLDVDKLNHVNNHYIRLAGVDRLVALAGAVHDLRSVAFDEAVLARTIPLVRDGAKTIVELADLTAFAFKTRPLEQDDKTRGLLGEETRARLSRLAGRLAGTGDWSYDGLGQTLRAFAEAEGVGMGKFGPALRAALCGPGPGPDLATALASLGKAESLGRIDDALSQLR
jgi:glutamyl-tRNA synthetase